jgi:hypothetical protein
MPTLLLLLLMMMRLELQAILMAIAIIIDVVIVIIDPNLLRLCQVVFQRPHFVQQVVHFEVNSVVPEEA